MTYNPDGTIQELPYFHECTLRQVENFNPYRKVEAETMSWGYGLKTTQKNPWAADHWNQLVTDINDGEYIKVSGVDFGNGASSFEVSASCHLYGGSIEVRLDTPEGQCIGTVNIYNTKTQLKTFTTKVKSVKGVHDLYFVFRGSKNQKCNLFMIDSWKFTGQ